MTPFQILLVVVLGTLLVITLAAFVRRAGSRPALAGWSMLWLVGLVASFWPQSTTTVANVLGIRRGTDLLLYCTTLLALGGLFMLYVKLRRVRRDLTVLTRHLAVLDAQARDDDDASAAR